MFPSTKTMRISCRIVLFFLLFAFASGASFANSFSLGLSVPYIGQSAYQGESVMLLNLAPIALEYSVVLTQIHDQDFGGNYWGIGLTAGYSWTLGSFRIRTGLWLGYHQLYDLSLSIPDSSKRGIAIGLTLLEAGVWLF